MFHISDEPSEEHKADYLKAKAVVEPYLCPAAFCATRLVV